MVAVPGGTFEMGSEKGEPGREGDEAPRRRVTIRPFYVSKYEITEAQWGACVAAQVCKPLRQSQGPDYPVWDLRWKEAEAYINWLSVKTAQTYRFLSEAEWEYAARAGAKGLYATGDTITKSDANYAASGYGGVRPVGQYKPNAYGLYDMHGNAWEWVADCYRESGYYQAPSDGSAVTGECQMHVLRGGAYDTRPEQLRMAYRYRAQFGGAGVGLRVAREP
ncbi:formylglycine-generating enzyme family protein [Asticcacaulis sp. YBE204]|uniref:formylglycine-generating enzyme family protein n=1 Tax=Asticcacaulis sp. YBE204 TaxID=1282363 RepID=UPI00138ADA9C|nr:formylglycine-generating enzyme family protein [Asticcacaulis sp. YBE204]